MHLDRRHLFVLALGVSVLLVLFPIRTTLVRTALLSGGATALILGLSLAGARVRIALLVAVGLGAGLFALPAWTIEPTALRAAYLDAVHERHGAFYVWGGENRLGIDCSGLVRLPLASALFRKGILHLNGGVLRTAAALWWTDASAVTLGQGSNDRARLVAAYPNALAVDQAQVLPGDFAITQDGKHAMVYAGNDRWIEADPRLGRVVTLTAGVDESLRLRVPIRVMRWSLLEAKGRETR